MTTDTEEECSTLIKVNLHNHTVIVVITLDYYENSEMTRNQLHHVAEYTKSSLP